MNLIIIAFRLAAAIFAVYGSCALAAPHAKAGLGDAFPQVCASGYHTDAGGNCQPAVAQTDRFCPPHRVFHPTFDGWNCDPPPPEAY